MDPSYIRNFCIIAHIDHGKSTLADRFLEYLGAITEREKRDQYLDQMDLEREKGITIKAQTVRLRYIARDGKEYQFNLIDTPGHVDFHYEVSRSLAACEGAILLVDASQGVQAQTVANALLAREQGLRLLPVINKIDLPIAKPEEVKKQLEEILAIPSEEAFLVSAKTGQGVREVFEGIVRRLPPPKERKGAPRTQVPGMQSLRALLMDSWFDAYQGAVVLVRIVDGEIRVGQRIRFLHMGKDYEVTKLGIFTPKPQPVEILHEGEVGFVIAGVKEIRETRIGDTITDAITPAARALPGFKAVKPMVFAGLYPVDSEQYEDLKEALEKLRLNDASFHYEPETSLALGFGFRCGFLGSLHMEIVKERLEREYNLSLITTAPTVVYEVRTKKGKMTSVDNPAKFPETQEIDSILEPYARVHIHSPSNYVGEILKLCEGKRGEQKGLQYFGAERILLTYEIPFAEIMFDFYDRLKSLSQGYASLDYEIVGCKPGDLVKLNILINGDLVDALSSIVHKGEAYYKGRELASKLREVIPRQLFEVAIQAAVGSKVIARETVKAFRKDVIAKCYGGDITRKRKLLERQKEGKKKMKRIGRVDIPQEAFLSVLKIK